MHVYTCILHAHTHTHMHACEHVPLKWLKKFLKAFIYTVKREAFKNMKEH